MFLKHRISINYASLITNRHFHTNKLLKTIQHEHHKNPEINFGQLLKTHMDKIIYNTYLSQTHPQFNFKKRLELKKLQNSRIFQEKIAPPISHVLKYVDNAIKNDLTPIDLVDVPKKENSTTHFPYASQTISVTKSNENIEIPTDIDIADRAKLETETRHEYLANVNNWMHDYENYEDDNGYGLDNDWTVNYGTPDPKSTISNVPCGGCGALLHCKDTAIPGYLPSEIFKNASRREGVHLKALTCQRCHFLKFYNLALQVRVSSSDYINVLESIKNKNALILLTVDLFDFPCSLWPGIFEILGSKQPIVVVGNKADLLPQDSESYLERIRKVVEKTVKELLSNKAASNIKHVALISAKTGWGVEELITTLHSRWGARGDVYVVGCTNVGKSSLFNCLLQSDFCKVQAVDLIQRATTSLWPGTTMNMLKFPIMRPSGWQLYSRTKRLQALNKIKAAERNLNKMRLKETNEARYATLMGHIDRTFKPELQNSSDKSKIGINDEDPVYSAGKWCYDTPGVEHPEQIIHLLTTEELMLSLPRSLIQPKTFSIRVGQTIFIAGLARLDYLNGPNSILVTVFCSDSLPITMCYTEHACLLYETFIGSDIFLVPKGSQDRLNKWPDLKEGKLLLKLEGVNSYVCCGDIVLSNAGWISVNSNTEVTFKAWTPEARGIYIRDSLLPFAVQLRGRKIQRTPAYLSDKYFISKK